VSIESPRRPRRAEAGIRAAGVCRAPRSDRRPCAGASSPDRSRATPAASPSRSLPPAMRRSAQPRPATLTSLEAAGREAVDSRTFEPFAAVPDEAFEPFAAVPDEDRCGDHCARAGDAPAPAPRADGAPESSRPADAPCGRARRMTSLEGTLVLITRL